MGRKEQHKKGESSARKAAEPQQHCQGGAHLVSWPAEELPALLCRLNGVCCDLAGLKCHQGAVLAHADLASDRPAWQKVQEAIRT
jgi:hypothetical protein